VVDGGVVRAARHFSSGSGKAGRYF